MFLVKKIVSQFLFPLPFGLIISILGLCLLWFTKRQKSGKIIVSVGLFIILLFSYAFVSNSLLKPLERKYEPYNFEIFGKTSISNEENLIKYVVVLGGGHTQDPKLPITSKISYDSLVRLIEGIRIYRKHEGSKLILSVAGGFGSVPVSKTMAYIARDLGVKEEDIIMESKSKDTKDEARIIRSIIDQESFVLVTSASHMPRSIAMFRKFGMNPIPAPTGHTVKEPQNLSPGFFFPDAKSLYRSKIVFYEYLGTIWAKLRGQVE